MIYALDFRSADVGGGVVPGRLTMGYEDAFRWEPRVTFLFHGFNVDRVHGRQTLLRFAELLSGAEPGAAVAVLWPGDSWIGPLGYPFEGPNADDTAAQLVNFIHDKLNERTPLRFVAHSLGCRVVMRTLAQLQGKPYPVEQACLMAAAIDDDSLSCPEEFRSGALAASRIAVLSSRSDRVLKYAYPAGDLLQAFIYWQRDVAGLALGYHGPRRCLRNVGEVPTTVVPVQIPDERGADHGDYLPPPDPQALSPEQISAAKFADAVISGMPSPTYS